MEKRALGGQGLEVSAEGLGCMGMTWAYGRSDLTEAMDTIHLALDLGVTFLDTAEMRNAVTGDRCPAEFAQLIDR